MSRNVNSELAPVLKERVFSRNVNSKLAHIELAHVLKGRGFIRANKAQ